MLEAGISFLVSFVLVYSLLPFFIRTALKHKILAFPKPDRFHRKATPLLGGIPLLLSFTFVSGGLAFKYSYPEYFWTLLGGLLIMGIGLLDDLKNLSPWTKLVSEIVVISSLMVAGRLKLSVITGVSAYLVPLGVFVFIINSINLLDNMDGLASGITGITIVGLGITFFSSHSSFHLLAAFGLFGSILAFFFYNRPPARIFLGDAGSLALGYFVACFLLASVNAFLSAGSLTFCLGAFLLFIIVPCLDTFWVIVLRTSRKISIFTGGRDHISHHLMRRGMSPAQTLALLCAVQAAGVITGTVILLVCS